jgi:diadenosine tetraphosphatase ApaH/serine/threonine PP2A family protein phosphatase
VRTAVFSDVHANIEALEAVVNDAVERGAEQFVCLGDVVGYNADPIECIDMLRQRNDLICLQGNHDAMAAGIDSLHGINSQAKASMLWTRKVLTSDMLTWLANLPLVHDDEHATYVHASLPAPASWVYVRDAFSARRHFEAQTAEVCFIGHSHHPGAWRQTDGDPVIEKGDRWSLGKVRLLINVGSVGQPRDGDPRSCYCLYDTVTRDVTMIRVAYDVAATQAKIIAADLPAAIAERLIPTHR